MRHRLFFLLFFFCMVSSEPLSFSFVFAEESAEQLKTTLNSLSSQIKALDQEIKTYTNKINQTQGEAKTLKQALARLEERKKLLVKDIDYTKLRIKKTEANITFTKAKITSTESALDVTKAALAESFRVLVRTDNDLPQFVYALAEDAHITDVVDRSKRVADVSHAINEKVRALVDVKTTLAIQKASYEEHKHILDSLNETLTEQKELVDQSAKDKNTLLVQTKNKESTYQQLLAERKKKKIDLEAEMSDLEDKLKTIVDASKLPRYGKGILQYPVENVLITQYFGNTPFASKNPQVYNGAGHNGLDFGVKTGTPILAAREGTVLGTGNTDTSCSGVSYGKWVLIQHDNGLTTLYAHLSTIGVSAGEKVTKKQKIGLSGNTGYSTGPHLHFTLYASDAVQITNYKSKVCGTNMTMPVAPRAGYLNPLSYL